MPVDDATPQTPGGDFGQADFSDYERPDGRYSVREAEAEQRRRQGPSDSVLWAVITERLEAERRLDLSGVKVTVENAEVTLNGTIKRKEDKRRIEDVADIDGVRHVQNNLRVRDHGLFG